MVKIVTGELVEVIINIINNAKDILIARDIQNALIDVKVYQKENYCITEITDNGGGILVEPMEKVFDPFFTTKMGEGGTGLGLNICKKILELMDGKIWFESEENKGTTFFVELPLQ